MAKAKAEKPKAKPEKLYAVLQKGNRLMVITKPEKKQLRRYEKRNWLETGIILNDNDDADSFRDLVNGITQSFSK